MHKNYLQSDVVSTSTCFHLGFNSDCSWALLYASGKRNDCISSNERTGGWKRTCLKLVDAVQPPKIQTWLLGKVWGEDVSFPTYNNHNRDITSNFCCWIRRQLSPYHTYCGGHNSFPLQASGGLCCSTLIPTLTNVEEIWYNEQGRITA